MNKAKIDFLTFMRDYSMEISREGKPTIRVNLPRKDFKDSFEKAIAEYQITDVTFEHSRMTKILENINLSNLTVHKN